MWKSCFCALGKGGRYFCPELHTTWSCQSGFGLVSGKGCCLATESIRARCGMMLDISWHILKFMQDCTHCRWLKTSKNTGPIGCSRPGFHWLLPTVVHGWTQSSRLWHLAAQVTVGVAIVAIRSAAHVLRLKVLLESLGLVGLVGLEPVKPVKFTAMIACEVLSMAWLWQAMAELCALPGRELRRARVHQLQQHETCLGHRQLSYSA